MNQLSTAEMVAAHGCSGLNKHLTVVYTDEKKHYYEASYYVLHDTYITIVQAGGIQSVVPLAGVRSILVTESQVKP